MKPQHSETWRRFKKSPTALLGLAILSVFLLLTVCADWLAPYTQAITPNIAERLGAPSATHLFGTDGYGRDIFARMLHGGRVSLSVGIACSCISVLFGSALGACASYYGSVTDNIIMRLMDVLMSIPPILLAIAIVAALGTGIINLLIAISLANIPRFTRLTRSVILTIVEQEFIRAAKSYGASDGRIIARYILPNAFGPIMVSATMSVATMVLETSALSFLGLGVAPPRPEWGAMLSEAREHIRTFPFMILIPGLAILLVSLSLNLVGDGLRDAFDPRLRD